MPKILFFDIDDTLFPSTEFAEQARRNAIRAMIGMGVEESEERLYKLLCSIIKEKGSNYPGHFDDMCKSLGIKRPARFVAAAVAAYHDTKTSIQPFPEVPKSLLSLREAGYKLFVATNGEPTKQWDKLIRLRVALYFEDVFVSGEIGEEKGPSFFKKILKALDARPQDCIMIGDREEADIAPAKSIGMHTIRMKAGKFAGVPSSADATIDEFGRIIEVLKTFKTAK